MPIITSNSGLEIYRKVAHFRGWKINWIKPILMPRNSTEISSSPRLERDRWWADFNGTFAPQNGLLFNIVLPQKTSWFTLDFCSRNLAVFYKIFATEKELIFIRFLPQKTILIFNVLLLKKTSWFSKDICPRHRADFQYISAPDNELIFKRYLPHIISWFSKDICPRKRADFQ